MRYRVLLGIAVLGLLQPLSAAAVGLNQNEASNNGEWRAWPEYCKARFVAYSHLTGNPLDRSWERSVSPAMINKWAAIIGEPMWTAMHHYCRGLVVLQRYRRLPKTEDTWRKHMASNAIEEFLFTLAYKDANPRFAAIMMASLGLAHHYAGNSKAALNTITEAIRDQPDIVDAYSAGYVILREAGQRDQALQMLEKCFENSAGKSAENNYFLALEYYERKDYEKSRTHAQKATELGYPLRGVHRRLQALGKW